MVTVKTSDSLNHATIMSQQNGASVRSVTKSTGKQHQKAHDDAQEEEIVPTGRLYEHEPLPEHSHEEETDAGKMGNKSSKGYQVQIVWRNILLFLFLHLSAPVGLYLALTLHAKAATTFFALNLMFWSAFGITAGAHRLWAHRSYKAKLPLRLLLILMNTIAFQNDVYEWSRDHRVHHKFSETNADPHNSKRGFFFAHIGWLLCKKHPDVMNKGKSVDMSDLLDDPVVYYQKKFYPVLIILICFGLPILVPWYFWQENIVYAFLVCVCLRYCVTLNCTWLVNSAAHIWGHKPYDKNMSASENRSVAMTVLGEGWHNYHHAFPWDYKTSEWGTYSLNLTAAFIDFFAWIGWAYDLKSVPKPVIQARVDRTGDGTHHSKPGGFRGG